jgi:hypothetical protein
MLPPPKTTPTRRRTISVASTVVASRYAFAAPVFEPQKTQIRLGPAAASNSLLLAPRATD